MSTLIATISPEAEALLPPAQPDGSGIGVNYVDAVLKTLPKELEDGRKLSLKRKGLKLTLQVGDARGEGLMRRLEHGPDPREVFREALAEAARATGGEIIVENQQILLVPPPSTETQEPT